jgi:tetratricopeptide (TPR) repeat protein
MTAIVYPSNSNPFLRRNKGYTLRIFCAFLTIFILLSSTPVQSEDIASLLKEGDRLWEQRMDKKSFDASFLLYKKALEGNPSSYEANWRISRSYFWLSDQLGDSEGDEHKTFGETGMQYGKVAMQQNPSGIEGHYYYALNLTQYGLGISIIKALAIGLGSEYEEHMKTVLTIHREYDDGGAFRAMGRYFYKLPWPKRDVKKSIEYLKEAVRIAPWNCRGHVYLAESFLKKGERSTAREELTLAINGEENRKKEVDQSRWKEIARMLLKREFKEEVGR